MASRSSPDPSERSATSPPAADAAQRDKYAGRRLGKFQILGELGRGGMGVVLEARDTVLERHVAIKMLPRSVAAQPDALQRFLREARVAARLNHPHVVAVYDADQFNGQYYIVLELVRGGNLQDSLQAGPLCWREATRVVADACRGLEVAHRAGLVHRDIKPSNLMRAEDGTVKLSDFGLARPVTSTSATVTASGDVLGTPQFMSPEQCRSELADARSDVYSMGATYYALLTGRVPYPGQAPLLVMNAHLWNKIPDPRDVDPTIPHACSAIIQRAMAKEPDDRHPDALALLGELETVLAESKLETAVTAAPQGLGTHHAKRATTRQQESISPSAKRRPLEKLWSAGTRPLIRAVVLSALAVGALIVGWKLWPEASPLPARPETRGVAPSAAPAERSGASRLPTAMLPDDAFRLPGMRQDQQGPAGARESWRLNYPGITHVQVANSGEFLVTLTNESAQASTTAGTGRAQVWNQAGKKLLDEPLPGRATSAAISRDSRRLAVGLSAGKGVLLWNTTTWQHEPPAVSPSGEDVDAVALSDDGQWLAFTTSKARNDGAWVLWDLAAGKQKRRTASLKGSRMRTIALAPQDELLVLTGHDDGSLRLWPGMSDDQPPRQMRAGLEVAAISPSPHESLVAVGAGKYFSLWNYQLDKREYATPSSKGDITCVAYAPTGRQICWGAGRSVQCIDTASRRTVATFDNARGNILALAYLPDASRIFAACADGALILWWIDQRSGKFE